MFAAPVGHEEEGLVVCDDLFTSMLLGRAGERCSMVLCSGDSMESQSSECSFSMYPMYSMYLSIRSSFNV